MTKWVQLYDFEYNKERTLDLLKMFKIEKYHISTTNGVSSLTINIHLNNYNITIDEHREVMVIKKKQITRRGQRHPKEFLREIKTVKCFSNDCLFNVLKWVVEDGRL